MRHFIKIIKSEQKHIGETESDLKKVMHQYRKFVPDTVSTSTARPSAEPNII